MVQYYYSSTDVLLLDLRMPGKSGIDVCRELTDKECETRVLVLTSFDDDEEVFGYGRVTVAGGPAVTGTDTSRIVLPELARIVIRPGFEPEERAAVAFPSASVLLT